MHIWMAMAGHLPIVVAMLIDYMSSKSFHQCNYFPQKMKLCERYSIACNVGGNTATRTWGISSIFGSKSSPGERQASRSLGETAHHVEQMPSMIQLREVILLFTEVYFYVSNLFCVIHFLIFQFILLSRPAPIHLKATWNDRAWSSSNKCNKITLAVLLWHCQKEHSRLSSKSCNALSGKCLSLSICWLYIWVTFVILSFDILSGPLMFILLLMYSRSIIRKGSFIASLYKNYTGMCLTQGLLGLYFFIIISCLALLEFLKNT